VPPGEIHRRNTSGGNLAGCNRRAGMWPTGARSAGRSENAARGPQVAGSAPHGQVRWPDAADDEEAPRSARLGSSGEIDPPRTRSEVGSAAPDGPDPLERAL
jgi:hypothetical protein